MKINEEYKGIFKDFKIPYEDGVGYLLSLYYGIELSHIPEQLKQKVLSTGAVSYDKGVKWIVPLFEEQITQFDWVKTEYVPLFKNANSEKGGNITSSIQRMKKFFTENPDIRKQDVLEATKLYISKTDPTYLRLPHYFIYKDKGVNKISDLLEWVQAYREIVENQPRSSQKSLNTMIR